LFHYSTNSHQLPFLEGEKPWFYGKNAKSWQHIMNTKAKLQEIEVHYRSLKKGSRLEITRQSLKKMPSYRE